MYKITTPKTNMGTSPLIQIRVSHDTKVESVCIKGLVSKFT